MPIVRQKITPCLWFDSEADEAARFYVSVFANSRIGRITRYAKDWDEKVNGKKPGSVMTVEFELDGQGFVALNGGPHFKFSEAVSFQVHCDTQEEIDHFWAQLAEGGEEGPCGWLKDRFGLSWQVTPAILPQMLSDPDADRSQRVTAAFLQMKKFDLAELQRAYEGQG